MAQVPVIPGYKILSELGEGGMAKVYLGIQEKLKRRVAIKILDPVLLTDPKTAERFGKEAEIAANLQHSNIIQIFDTGKTGDYHYIVMEYLRESLADRMKQYPENKMPPEAALDIINKMMSALDYAHWQGVFHRDIKPDNIMFRQDSTPVLMDFGISLLFATRDNSPRITREGLILGTVDYMSPEQCRNEKDIDGRSDTYSLGVVLYEMLMGRKPYEGDSQMHIAFKHTQEPVPRLPGELNRYQPLLDSMMAKSRDRRISSGAQFLQLWEKIDRGMVEAVSPTEELLLDDLIDIPLAEPGSQEEVASSPGEDTRPEMSELPDDLEIPGEPETMEVPGKTAESLAPGSPGGLGVPGTPKAPETFEVPEPLEEPEAPEAPEPTEIREVPSAAEKPDEAEATPVATVPEIPEIPELPEMPTEAEISKVGASKPEPVIKVSPDRFSDFFRERLKPFFKSKARDLDTLKDHTLEKLNPVMERPVMKIIFLGVLPGLVVLFFILMILFNSNAVRSNPPQEQSSSLLVELIKQAPQYYRDLERAREYYREGDYKSLEQARRILGRLKRITVIPEVEALELEIANRVSLLQRDFNRYYDEAIDYYYKGRELEKALESVRKAKEIYVTRELLELEQRIEAELEK